MDKKYKLLKRDRIPMISAPDLYRIEALIDFGDVKKGDKGGYIAKEDNLSHKQQCWVFDQAWVFGGAWVTGDARITGRSRVSGNAVIMDNAIVREDAWIKHGVFTGDTSNPKDLIQYIACSLGVYPVGGKYILYKRVIKKKKGMYVSSYDNKFYYYDGKIAFVKDYDKDPTISYSNGLHVSTPFYFYCGEGDTLITVEVKVKDIMACQLGELLVKKLKVIGEVKEFKWIQ